MPSKHRNRRTAWLSKLVSLARRRGDRRPRDFIVRDIEDRSDQIRRAENEAHRPQDGTAEVIIHIGCHYPLAGLHEGELLHRGLSYIHPMLVIN